MSRNKRKEVVYSLINQAADFATDEHWRKLLTDLSRGAAPKRINVDEQSVKFFSKKDGFTYVYSNQSPKDIASSLQRLIGKALCLYSERDIKTQQDEKSGESDEYKAACQLDDWKKIKNRKMKDHLIVNFVSRLKNEQDLSWKMARSLYQTINNAFYVYHTHKSNDVEMKNGEIDSIEDIAIERDLVYNERIFEVKEGKLGIREDFEDEVSAAKKKDLIHDWNRYITYSADYESVSEEENSEIEN
jgi:hypothetical protein